MFATLDLVRADRLLSLVYLLKARGKLSAVELARELEVSPRTILRDVQALSTAGVPVYCEQGRGGGISLMAGYRTDVSALSEQEAGALLTAIAAPGAHALGLERELASALRKVMAALPAQHRPATSRLVDRIVIDTGGWLPRHEEPRLATVQQAVLSDRRLRICYQGRRDEAATERTIDPYGLLLSGGVWYLVAAHRGRPRFYRVARIAEARVLDQPAHRPDDVDVRALWERSRAGYRAALTPLTVDLWLRRGRAGDLAGRAAGPPVEVDAAGWPAPADDGPSWVPLRVPFGDLRHAVQVVRDLGTDAVVIAPVSLRDVIVEQAAAVLAGYSTVGRRTSVARHTSWG